jgi:hypothetical protein
MVDKNESDSDESQNVEEDLSAEEDDDEENDEEAENEGTKVTKNGSNKRPIQISGSEVQ